MGVEVARHENEGRGSALCARCQTRLPPPLLQHGLRWCVRLYNNDDTACLPLLPLCWVLCRCGMAKYTEQEAELRARPDLVVCTPGRMVDHLTNSASVHMDDVEILVLDEVCMRVWFLRCAYV